MTCSTCVNWTPKPTNTPAAEKEGVRIMARNHFAVCSLGPRWVFMPPTGKCNDWKAAPADVVSKRVEWLEKDKA